MSLQNYTLYTETDPNNRYTVTSTKIDVAGLDRSEDAHVVYDFGAGAFSGNFEHKVTVYINSASQNGAGLRMAWGLANAINDVSGLRGAAENYLECYIVEELAGAYASINIAEYYGSNVVDASGVLSRDTPYYLTIVRDETVGTYGTLYCYIYSDSGRTTLVDTLTLTLRAALDFRYCYGANSFNNSTTGSAFTGYVENLYVETQPATNIAIPKVDFNFTGKAPVVYNSGNDIDIAVGKADFNFTGKVPTVSVLSNVIVEVPIATFNFSRYAPTIRTTDIGIGVPKADFNFAGQAPSISVTGNSVISVGKATFNFTGYAPSVQLTNTEEEITWGLFDSDGVAITGASPIIKIRSRATGYILDWSDETFKAGGGSTPSTAMQEMDATNFQGYYRKIFTVTSWDNGWYVAATTYSAGTPKQNGSIEFKVQDGQIVDDYNSTNLDMALSTVNANVSLRLPTSSYTAPDNAGIASTLAEAQSHPTLAEMLAGGVAKEATLIMAQTDITSVLNYAIAMSKWKNNKLARTGISGTVETWVLYDTDDVTPLLQWQHDTANVVRTKAT